eukprot:6177572-Karenia_brevis.AAC.1
MEMPPAKAFSTHGAHIIKEVPIFQKVAHIHSSSSSSSLIPGIALSTQHLKQIRRLQGIINHTIKLLTKYNHHHHQL